MSDNESYDETNAQDWLVDVRHNLDEAGRLIDAITPYNSFFLTAHRLFLNRYTDIYNYFERQGGVGENDNRLVDLLLNQLPKFVRDLRNELNRFRSIEIERRYNEIEDEMFKLPWERGGSDEPIPAGTLVKRHIPKREIPISEEEQQELLRAEQDSQYADRIISFIENNFATLVRNINNPFNLFLSLGERYVLRCVYNYLHRQPLSQRLRETVKSFLAWIISRMRRGVGGDEPEPVDYEALKHYSISDQDIQQAIGVKPFLYYPDLQNVKSISQLFDKKGRACILFLTTSSNHGHWTCLMKRPNKVIEYFDSYGGYGPDGERKWLSHKELVNLHEDQPLLYNLLKKSKYKILYNPYPYQSHSPDTNTCGKHCITRLYYHKLTEPEYHTMIRNSGMTPDQFVMSVVYSLIGK